MSSVIYYARILSSAATTLEGLPPSVMLTITKLQCLLQSRQERIQALERQVEDLQQDRKFLRTQIENLTSTRQAAAPERKSGGQGKVPSLNVGRWL